VNQAVTQDLIIKKHDESILLVNDPLAHFISVPAEVKGLLGGLALAWFKAASLQLGHGLVLSELADRQYRRNATYKGLRGNIYDRNGELLATSLLLDSVYAEPRNIKEPERVIKVFRELMPELPNNTLQQLNSKKAFMWIGRRIHPKVSQKPPPGMARNSRVYER
jgi:cell division protein FtsI/penicillin-binding protein 2